MRAIGACRPRVVLVGAGRWGSVHARTVAAAGGELVAVVDVRREAAERLARMHGVPFYTSFREALEKVRPDAVVIAVPPEALPGAAREALEHGVNVLVEKPVALRASDAELLSSIARAKGLVGVAGYLLRFHPVTLELKRLISTLQPWMLELYRVAWRPANARRWPIDFDLAVHDVDLALYLLGCERVIVKRASLESLGGGSLYTLHMSINGVEVKIVAGDSVEEGVKYRAARLYARGAVIEAFFDEGRMAEYRREPRTMFVSGEKPLTLEHRAFYSLVCGSSMDDVENLLGARPATLDDAARVLRILEEARGLLSEP